MTDDKKRIEEIRSYVNFMPNYDNRDFRFLLAQIDKRDEALREAKDWIDVNSEEMDCRSDEDCDHCMSVGISLRIGEGLGED